MSERVIYRILDAAANRGREALRVIEDAARYIDDNKEFSAALKAARHRLAAAAEQLDRRERLLARDTVGDVGVTIEAEDEYRRDSLAQLMTANFARLQEAARSLEEYSKFVAPKLAREFERVRYESYTLEKVAYELALRFDNAQNDKDDTPRALAAPRREETRCEQGPFARRPRSRREALRDRLNRASLACLIDSSLSADAIDALFAANIGAFQLDFDRDDVAEREAMDLFLGRFHERYIKTGVSSARRPLLISRGFSSWGDVFDGGVVLENNWAQARENIGDDRLLGAYVSDLDEALAAFDAAEKGEVDFVELGPVFSDDPRENTVGVEFLRGVLERFNGETPVPVYAYGGIDLDTCEAVFDAGIERVCVDADIAQGERGANAFLQLSSML